MTKRERIYKLIEELKEERKKLTEEQERIMLRLYEIEIEIGECKGGLAELDYLDGMDY